MLREMPVNVQMENYGLQPKDVPANPLKWFLQVEHALHVVQLELSQKVNQEMDVPARRRMVFGTQMLEYATAVMGKLWW